MLRTVKLLVVDTDEEITIPVTPESFQVSKGIRVETINIHQVGDANLLGYGTLDTITLPLILPSTADSGYPFAHTMDTDAYGYIEKFTTLQENKKRVRFIVSDTPVNVLCVIESVEYGERDGTNDVYGTLTLREYRELKAAKLLSKSKVTQERSVEKQPTKPETYIVEAGDNLWAICQEIYGDGSLCYKLASYNGIKNANLIHPGDILQLPSADTLKSTSITCDTTQYSGTNTMDKVSSAAQATSNQQNLTAITGLSKRELIEEHLLGIDRSIGESTTAKLASTGNGYSAGGGYLLFRS